MRADIDPQIDGVARRLDHEAEADGEPQLVLLCDNSHQIRTVCVGGGRILMSDEDLFLSDTRPPLA